MVLPRFTQDASEDTDSQVSEATLLNGVEEGYESDEVYQADPLYEQKPRWSRQRIVTGTVRLLLFIVPSPLTAQIFPDATASPHRKHKTSYLDGLRASAAITVLIYHFSHAIWESSAIAWGVRGEYSFLKLPIIRLLYSGSFSVALLFVISGFALSIKPAEYMEKRKNAKLFENLRSASFRRPFRLFLPAFASTAIIMVVLLSGIMEWGGFNERLAAVKKPGNAAEVKLVRRDDELIAEQASPLVTPSPTLVQNIATTVLEAVVSATAAVVSQAAEISNTTLAEAGLEEPHKSTYYLAKLQLASNFFVQYIKGCFKMMCVFDTTFHAEEMGHPFDPALWPIVTEFRGSILLFTVHLGVSMVRGAARFALVGFLIALAVIMGSWDMLLFLSGFMLAMADLRLPSWKEHNLTTARNQAIWRSMVVSLVVIGLYLGSYPDWLPEEATGYGLLSKLIPPLYQTWEKQRFWQGVGAILVVFGVGQIPALTTFYSSAPLRYLGRITYSLYLMNTVTLLMFGCSVLYYIWQIIGSDTSTKRSLGFLIALAATLPFAIWLGDMFMRVVERPCQKFARRLESRSFDKLDVVESKEAKVSRPMKTIGGLGA